MDSKACLCDSEQKLEELDTVLDSKHGGIPRHLGLIADSMDEWEGAIADCLGLTQAACTDIKMQFPHQLNLQVRSVLSEWKLREGSRATYTNLISAFRRAGYQNYADAVHRILSDGDKLYQESVDMTASSTLDFWTPEKMKSAKPRMK